MPLIFEDLLHLVKCIRYRMVSGSGICIFPDRDDVLQKYEFLSIEIPVWVLDNSNARKMDDKLPLMMYHRQNLYKAILKSNLSLVIALLPSVLLIDSVFNEDLERKDRLDCLSLCFAMCYIYREYYK